MVSIENFDKNKLKGLHFFGNHSTIKKKKN